MKNWKLLLAEFVVIVAGVLVAFWLDDWRETTKNERKTRDQLESLSADLVLESEDLEGAISYGIRRDSSCSGD